MKNIFVTGATGDIASCYANCDKAFSELSWKAEKTLEDMCKDSLKYYKK